MALLPHGLIAFWGHVSWCGWSPRITVLTRWTDKGPFPAAAVRGKEVSPHHGIGARGFVVPSERIFIEIAHVLTKCQADLPQVVLAGGGFGRCLCPAQGREE